MDEKYNITVKSIEVVTDKQAYFAKYSYTGPKDKNIINKGFSYGHYDQYGGFWVYLKPNPNFNCSQLLFKIEKDVTIEEQKEYKIEFDTYTASLYYPIPEKLREDIMETLKISGQSLMEGKIYDEIGNYFPEKKLFEDSIAIYHKKYPEVLRESFDDEQVDLAPFVLKIAEKAIELVNGDWDIISVCLAGEHKEIGVECEVVDTSGSSITGSDAKINYKNRYFKKEYKSKEKYYKRFHELNTRMHKLWLNSSANIKSEWNRMTVKQFRNGEVRLSYEWYSIVEQETNSEISGKTVWNVCISEG